MKKNILFIMLIAGILTTCSSNQAGRKSTAAAAEIAKRMDRLGVEPGRGTRYVSRSILDPRTQKSICRRMLLERDERYDAIIHIMFLNKDVFNLRFHQRPVPSCFGRFASAAAASIARCCCGCRGGRRVHPSEDA